MFVSKAIPGAHFAIHPFQNPASAPPDSDRVDQPPRQSACDRLRNLTRTAMCKVRDLGLVMTTGAMAGAAMQASLATSTEGAMAGAIAGAATMAIAHAANRPDMPDWARKLGQVPRAVLGTGGLILGAAVSSAAWSLRFPANWSVERRMNALTADLPPEMQSIMSGMGTALATMGSMMAIPHAVGLTATLATLAQDLINWPATQAGTPLIAPESDLKEMGKMITACFFVTGILFHSGNLNKAEFKDPFGSQVYPDDGDFHVTQIAMASSIKVGFASAMMALLLYMRDSPEGQGGFAERQPKILGVDGGLVNAILRELRGKGAATATVAVQSALTTLPKIGAHFASLPGLPRAVLELLTTPVFLLSFASAIHHDRLLGANADTSTVLARLETYNLELSVFIAGWLIELANWELSKTPAFLATVNADPSTLDKSKTSVTMVAAQFGAAMAADLGLDEAGVAGMPNTAVGAAALAFLVACVTQGLATCASSQAAKPVRNATDLGTRSLAVIATAFAAGAMEAGPVAWGASAAGVALAEVLRHAWPQEGPCVPEQPMQLEGVQVAQPQASHVRTESSMSHRPIRLHHSPMDPFVPQVYSFDEASETGSDPDEAAATHWRVEDISRDQSFRDALGGKDDEKHP